MRISRLPSEGSSSARKTAHCWGVPIIQDLGIPFKAAGVFLRVIHCLPDKGAGKGKISIVRSRVRRHIDCRFPVSLIPRRVLKGPYQTLLEEIQICLIIGKLIHLMLHPFQPHSDPCNQILGQIV